jgi:cell division protein FtsB
VSLEVGVHEWVSSVARRKFRLRWLVDGLIVVFIVMAALACICLYRQTSRELAVAIAKRDAAADKLEKLKLEVERIEDELERLRSDSRLIESLARQHLGLVHSGDVVIRIDQREFGHSTRQVVNLTPKPKRSYISN